MAWLSRFENIILVPFVKRLVWAEKVPSFQKLVPPLGSMKRACFRQATSGSEVSCNNRRSVGGVVCWKRSLISFLLRRPMKPWPKHRTFWVATVSFSPFMYQIWGSQKEYVSSLLSTANGLEAISSEDEEVDRGRDPEISCQSCWLLSSLLISSIGLLLSNFLFSGPNYFHPKFLPILILILWSKTGMQTYMLHHTYAMMWTFPYSCID